MGVRWDICGEVRYMIPDKVYTLAALKGLTPQDLAHAHWLSSTSYV